MFSSRTPGLSSLNKTQRASIAGVAAAGIAAITFSLVPGGSTPANAAEAKPAAAAPAALKATAGSDQASAVHAIIAKQQVTAENAAKIQQAATKAKAEKAAKVTSQAKTERTQVNTASRSDDRKPVYANNLDGWIRESLDIMKKHGIPGSYEGLHRNIMRESSGNPNAINLWDINAQNGIPSKGLLQVIPPTFKAYHVPGTSTNIYDPVANITAAANYAADRYGSMDNVNSAY
ncbi:transglycosylase SLT domain-containing protein [Streptomyces sp. NRRL F-5135]|uniref:transglycosylase SLT domain-containing protein n=1 Tax=Streptomyces sp. NRRL F-5135 TaxID=1463858 RepID=UPI0004C9802B|nr:transglycosylase SLT domain-containing protein [Streptomyces sp. NRRL F-5135]